jgi:hypothetical protein
MSAVRGPRQADLWHWNCSGANAHLRRFGKSSVAVRSPNRFCDPQPQEGATETMDKETVHEAAPAVPGCSTRLASYPLHAHARSVVAFATRAVQSLWSSSENSGSLLQSIGTALAPRSAKPLARLFTSALKRPISAFSGFVPRSPLPALKIRWQSRASGRDSLKKCSFVGQVSGHPPERCTRPRQTRRTGEWLKRWRPKACWATRHTHALHRVQSLRADHIQAQRS